jgi:hypothetical protein
MEPSSLFPKPGQALLPVGRPIYIVLDQRYQTVGFWLGRLSAWTFPDDGNVSLLREVYGDPVLN